MLRLPIVKIIDESMETFYKMAGNESDFRRVVNDLTERSLKQHIDAVSIAPCAPASHLKGHGAVAVANRSALMCLV